MRESLIASCLLAVLCTVPALATPILHVGGSAMHDDMGGAAGSYQYSHDPYYINWEPATVLSGPLSHDTGIADWHGHAKARSAATASFGSLGVYSYTSMYSGPTRAQAVARADANFEDDWTITLPGQTAPFMGALSVTIHIHGNLFGEDNDVVHSYTALSLTNFTKGSAQYKLPLGLTDEDVIFQIPFEYGKVNHVSLGMFAETVFYNEKGASLNLGEAYGDFLHTANITGLTCFDAQGQLISQYNLTTASGAAYVPEPSSILLGFAVLTFASLRRRSRGKK